MAFAAARGACGASWLPRCGTSRLRCPPLKARPRELQSDASGAGLMHPGPCGTEGCSLEEVVASVGCRELPTLDERRHLADRLAQRSSLPLARPLAAALQEQQAAAGRCAEEDAVWTYGACAAQPGGDVWSLLCLAKHAADAGGAALVQRHRRQLYAASLRLVHAAACGVHAAPHQWDAWLAGGVHAALGSFLVLRSSGGGAAELAAQLAAVSALVTEAASQEGGAELWLLQDVLAQQEGRLSLEAALAGAP